MSQTLSALLLEKGFQFKKHSGVRDTFNKDFIATGRVQRKYGDVYNQLFDDRLSGDYIALTEFNAGYVQEKIELCQDFLAYIRPLFTLLLPDVKEE